MSIIAQEHEQNLLPPADLATEIQRLEEELTNERDRHLRTLAEFKNYRRRIERDGNKFAETAIRKILLSFLDIIDDIEHALQSTSEDERPIADGIKMIHQKFLALLKKEDVRPLVSIGEKFDPELHEAVAMVKRKGVDHGIIIDDMRRGYFWKKELLRPAQVCIAE
ncbi:MAG: nucleotide exchange factor GrpE [Ignavibacteriales bacterium]|nr:nucleotide exchange factor GrpE [Ignavibacteriales bacterium]